MSQKPQHVLNQMAALRERKADKAVQFAGKRAEIAKRVDGDWAEYWFSDAERDLWVRFGIPADHAPLLALICTEIHDIPGFVMTPNRLAMRLSEGTVLHALLRGQDSTRLEDRIASALGRKPIDSVLAWRRAIYRSKVEPIKSRTDISALRTRLHSLTAVPELFDSLVSRANIHGSVFGQRFQLQYQARLYLLSGEARPAALLLSYARCMCVLSDDVQLREVALALRAPDDDARNYHSARIYAANARTRHLYFVGVDAHEQMIIHAASYSHSLHMDATRLPSTTGFVSLDGDGEGPTWAVGVLAWRLDAASLHVMLSPASQTLRNLGSGSVHAISKRKVATIPLEQSASMLAKSDVKVAALMSAFLDVLDIRPLSGPKVHVDDQDKGVRQSREPLSVRLLYSRRIAAPPRPEPSGIERTHQWTVRGHWRNQWRPSTKDHTRLWIEEHRAGPEDAPLMNRDRVRVLHG